MKNRVITTLLGGLLWAASAHAQSIALQPDSLAAITGDRITFVANPTRITSLDSLLKPHRGRVVYVDFWGTWCVPCRKEMPYAARLKETLKGEPVDFLYIAYENGYTAKLIANWKATVQKLHLTGRHFMMNTAFEGGLSEFLEVDSYPRYIIVDRDGEIMNDDAARPSETTEVLRQLRDALNR